jgi:hypothetical protein
MVKLIKRPNYFDHSTREIREHTDEGKGYEKERASTPTRIVKCSLVKEFILFYDTKDKGFE